MASIQQDKTIGKLPVGELQAELGLSLQPVLRRLPEKRLRVVGGLAVQGILGGQSPVVTHMRGAWRARRRRSGRRARESIVSFRTSASAIETYSRGCMPWHSGPWLAMRRRFWWWHWTQ